MFENDLKIRTFDCIIIPEGFLEVFLQLGGNRMEIKIKIIRLVQTIDSEHTLKIIYRFIKGLLD